MPGTRVEEWARARNFLHRQGTGEIAAYHCLNGGIIEFDPYTRHQVPFLRAVADDVASGAPLYLSECFTDVFRLVFDFDAKLPSDISPQQRAHLTSVVMTAVGSFYPPELHPKILRCLVEKRQAKQVQGSVVEDPVTGKPVTPQARLFKIGLHLRFPEIYVNVIRARLVREAVVRALEQDEAVVAMLAGTPVRTFVDHNVYVNKALRLPGSYKCVRCSRCKKKRNYKCRTCHGGSPDLTSVYRLCDVFTLPNTRLPQPDFEVYQQDYLQFLLDASARITADDPKKDWKKQLETKIKDNGAWFKFNADLAGVSAEHLSIHEYPEQGGRSDKVNVVVTHNRHHAERDPSSIYEPKMYRRIVELVTEFAGYRQFFDCEEMAVDTIKTNRDRSVFFIQVQGRGAHVCYNLQQPAALQTARRRVDVLQALAQANTHNSQKIYFVLSKKGLVVHCACRCVKLDGRLHGYCKDYRSNPMVLSAPDQAFLFPGQTNPKKKRKPKMNSKKKKMAVPTCQEPAADRGQKRRSDGTIVESPEGLPTEPSAEAYTAKLPGYNDLYNVTTNKQYVPTLVETPGKDKSVSAAEMLIDADVEDDVFDCSPPSASLPLQRSHSQPTVSHTLSQTFTVNRTPARSQSVNARLTGRKPRSRPPQRAPVAPPRRQTRRFNGVPQLKVFGTTTHKQKAIRQFLSMTGNIQTIRERDRRKALAAEREAEKCRRREARDKKRKQQYTQEFIC